MRSACRLDFLSGVGVGVVIVEVDTDTDTDDDDDVVIRAGIGIVVDVIVDAAAEVGIGVVGEACFRVPWSTCSPVSFSSVVRLELDMTAGRLIVFIWSIYTIVVRLHCCGLCQSIETLIYFRSPSARIDLIFDLI